MRALSKYDTYSCQMISMRHISVVGLGYVGLCTAVCLAVKGYKVIVSSNVRAKVGLINKGISPIYEPRLKTMLQETIRNGKLKAVLGREKAVLNSSITFITVGTPSLPSGGINLRFIRSSAKEIGKALMNKQNYHLVVVRSTVSPGTTENVIRPILERYSGKRAGKDFGLAMNPEFLREGSALYDIFHPDRIVIGEFDENSGQMLEGLYRELYGNHIPILRMSLASAEMVKYACNAFLATKISFINQVANICERIAGVDVVKIAYAMGLDPRISPRFLDAGAGWGGSCFPKDVKALIDFSKKIGYRPRLLEEVISINLEQAKHMIELAKEELGNLKDKKIALLGLSFKPNTDDVREASSMRVIDFLLKEGAKVHVFDPVAANNAKKVLGKRVNYSGTLAECLENADCCMLVTEWDEFKKLRPEDFTQFMKKPLLIDGRRIYDYKEFSKKLRLRAIGLGKTLLKEKL